LLKSLDHMKNGKFVATFPLSYLAIILDSLFQAKYFIKIPV
jgi:hypothetical protein